MSSSFVAITVDDTLLDDTTMGLLDSVVVENALNLPDAFTASFADPDGSVLGSLSSRLGRPVEISVTQDHSTAPVPIMKGELTSIEVDYDAAHSGSGTRTVVTGLDASYRLQHGRRTRSWRQATAA